MLKLPLDCEVEYHPGILSTDESAELYDDLCANYDVSNRSLLMADGSTHKIETGSFLFTDEDLVGYDKFSEVWGARAIWSPLLRTLKNRVEAATGHEFQVCRTVYYENGACGMDYHSDLPAYGDTTFIASVSIGEEREFHLRSKKNPSDIHRIVLGNGSLILMGRHCQDRYEHGIPRDPGYANPRINLTFRKYGFEKGA